MAFILNSMRDQPKNPPRIERELLSREAVEEILNKASLRKITVLSGDPSRIMVCLAHTLLKTMDELESLRERNITQ